MKTSKNAHAAHAGLCANIAKATRKAVTTALICVLLAGMLTACGGGGGSTSADAQAETAVMAAINENRSVSSVSSVKLQNSSELRKTANQSIDAAISGKLGQLSSDFKFVLDPNPEDGSGGFTLIAKCDYKNTDLAKLIKTVTNINSYNMNKWSEVGVVVRTVDGQTYIAISVAIKTKT